MPLQDDSDFLIDSSNWRMQVLKKCQPPKSKDDVVCMLGNSEGDTHRVFMDIRPEDTGKTIATSQCFILFKNVDLYIANNFIVFRCI